MFTQQHWFSSICNQNVTNNRIDSPKKKRIMRLQICAADGRISLTHQQSIPSRSSGCLHKKEVVFFSEWAEEDWGIGDWLGHARLIQPAATAVVRRRWTAPDARGASGEGRAHRGTERRGEDGDAEDQGEKFRARARGLAPRGVLDDGPAGDHLARLEVCRRVIRQGGGGGGNPDGEDVGVTGSRRSRLGRGCGGRGVTAEASIRWCARLRRGWTREGGWDGEGAVAGVRRPAGWNGDGGDGEGGQWERRDLRELSLSVCDYVFMCFVCVFVDKRPRPKRRISLLDYRDVLIHGSNGNQSTYLTPSTVHGLGFINWADRRKIDVANCHATLSSSTTLASSTDSLIH
jgi:hypothetical protein